MSVPGPTSPRHLAYRVISACERFSPLHTLGGENISLCFSIWLLLPSQKLPSQPRVLHCLLALSLLLVFWIACGGIGRLRGKRAPGWIISCSSMPDGHVAVTWRGNGKWHHYHSNTGTTFGVRAGIQRICHTTSHLTHWQDNNGLPV